MDAQTRRRERRAEKQAQWKAANPLLVGVSAKPVSLAGMAETMLVKFSNQQCSSDMHGVVGWKMVLQQASNRADQLRKGGNQ